MTTPITRTITITTTTNIWKEVLCEARLLHAQIPYNNNNNNNNNNIINDDNNNNIKQ